jgi:hypothetical protein
MLLLQDEVIVRLLSSMIAISLVKELFAGCCNKRVSEPIKLHCSAANHVGVCICLEEGKNLTISVGVPSSIVM